MRTWRSIQVASVWASQSAAFAVDHGSATDTLRAMRSNVRTAIAGGDERRRPQAERDLATGADGSSSAVDQRVALGVLAEGRRAVLLA